MSAARNCEHRCAVRPCQACGKPVAMRFKINRLYGGGKARMPHKCPHGKPCPTGGRDRLHTNNPTPTHLGGCRACNEREIAARR